MSKIDTEIPSALPTVPGVAECRFLMADEATKVTRKDTEGRTITGKGIVFNKRSALMMTEEGKLFYEIIHPEAVARAINDNSIWVDFQHKPSQLLGTQYAGTARFTLAEDSVIYEADAPNTTYANDMMELVDRGDVRGSSFVFISNDNKDVWTPADRTPGGTIIYQRDIYDILKIVSMGPVFGEAYPDTTVAARSLINWEERNKTEEPETPTPPAPQGHDPNVLAIQFG